MVFLHPRCPCSNATLSELRELVHHARSRAPLDVQVVVANPSGAAADFAETPLVAQARAMPGATVTVDDGTREMVRFGVQTSGDVLLYAPDGRRLFSGGVTTARGHEGESPARQRILSLLAGAEPKLATAPVFGCEVHTPGEVSSGADRSQR
jgi:hypothetical protein